MNPSGNLFLVGPMGAGKSTLGSLLAERLGMRFTDLDAAIERAAGMSVARIFATEGEAGFRLRETRALAAASAGDGLVLACGGGVVLAAGNREMLRERGFVIWLDAGVDLQLARLADDGTRPLLAAADRRERLESLARQRDPLYREVADLRLACTAASPAVAAVELAAALATAW